MPRFSTALVLDDCEIDQFFARRELERSLYFDTIHQFEDPELALAFLDECEDAAIDLLLLDFRMPGLNGLEFLQRLHQAELGSRVARVAVMMTVPLLAVDEKSFRHLDDDICFIPKPVDQAGIAKASKLAA